MALERTLEASDLEQIEPDPRPAFRISLDRDRLGQVAGLVDVESA